MNRIEVAIDSPAAAGAGTQAKLIAKHYNLFYLDTGKIYRFIGNLKIRNKKKFSYLFIKKKISKLKKLGAFKHFKNWQCMDTIRDKTVLEELLKKRIFN